MSPGGAVGWAWFTGDRPPAAARPAVPRLRGRADGRGGSGRRPTAVRTTPSLMATVGAISWPLSQTGVLSEMGAGTAVRVAPLAERRSTVVAPGARRGVRPRLRAAFGLLEVDAQQGAVGVLGGRSTARDLVLAVRIMDDLYAPGRVDQAHDITGGRTGTPSSRMWWVENFAAKGSPRSVIVRPSGRLVMIAPTSGRGPGPWRASQLSANRFPADLARRRLPVVPGNVRSTGPGTTHNASYASGLSEH